MSDEEPEETTPPKPGFKRFVIFSVMLLVACYYGAAHVAQYLVFVPLTVFVVVPGVYFYARYKKNKSNASKVNGDSSKDE